MDLGYHSQKYQRGLGSFPSLGFYLNATLLHFCLDAPRLSGGGFGTRDWENGIVGHHLEILEAG